MEFVPRWHLFKLVYHAGQRLNKVAHYQEPSRSIVRSIRSAHRDSNRVLTLCEARQQIVAADKISGFENWEYRFWGVQLGKLTHTNVESVNATICRFCGFASYAKSGRKTHTKERQCTIKLISCYADLLKRGDCVVCGKPTYDSKWGLPLHTDSNCMDEWMHEEPAPSLLAMAVNRYKGIRGQ